MSTNERNALKTALFTRFNIPPSSEFCQLDGSELPYRGIPKESCRGVNDSCIKITSEGDENQKLVIRGCKSTLVKPDIDLVTNYSCHHNSVTTSSECISSCQEPLCNNSHGRELIPILIAVYYLLVS